LSSQSGCGQHGKESQACQLKEVFRLLQIEKFHCLDHDEELGEGYEKRGLKHEIQEQKVTERKNDDAIEEIPFPFWFKDDAQGVGRKGE
jgi:hypothetical protein